MIIKNVPYINDKKEKYATCQGPPTTMMALRFFLPKLSMTFSKLYEKMNYKKGAWFFEMYIVQLFYEYKIPAIFYSTKPLEKCINKKCFKQISGLDYDNDKDLTEFDLEHYNRSIDFVLKKNLFKKKKEISIDYIKKQLSKSKLVISLINRNKLIDQEGYKGHFILIKGYTNKSFICNDALLGEDIRIPFGKFLDSFYYINREKPTDQKARLKNIVVIG